MHTNYQFQDKLVLRTPARPLVQQIDEASIRALLHDKGFLEALYLASPVLYDESLKLRDGVISSEKETQKIIRSLAKYYGRMSSRCTPFGLFSGCSVVGWHDGDTRLTLSPAASSRHTRLDMHYLCALAQKLAQMSGIREKLLYVPNTTLYRIGDEIRYIEYQYHNGRRTHQISSVTASPYLNNLLDHAKKGLKISELADLLMSEEVSREEGEEFVGELIQAQLLTSELEPAVTGPEFIHQILAVLQSIASPDSAVTEIIQTLEAVNNLLAHLDASEGSPADAYRHVRARLETLGLPCEENKLFQTDVVTQATGPGISVATQQQLAESLDVLNKLSPFTENDNLTHFARRFYERYEEKEMPLLEVLDTETGIGYLDKTGTDLAPLVDDLILPRKPGPQSMEWGRLEVFWKEKLLQALSRGSTTITLTAKDLEGFTSDWSNLSPSLSVLFRVIDNGEQDLMLEYATGSSAANLLGRFAHADPAINELVQAITADEQEREPDVLYAEIVHLPESRVGNVLLHPAFRAYEIPYMAKASVDEAHQIEVSDLYVSIRNKKIVLRSRRLGKEIIPRLSTAHNYTNNALPVYQFLCDLQSQGKRRGLQFSWGSLQQQFQFLPRVTYGNTVLHPATWKFGQKEVEAILKATGDLTRLIAAFRDGWKLPRYVVLSDGDNDLLVDLENRLLVDVWVEMIRKRPAFTLKEFFYNSALPIRDGAQAAYANQLVAVIKAKGQCYKTTNPPEQDYGVTRKFTVGSEWLYFKFYCGVKSADKILLEAIKPLTGALTEQGLIDRWFFIRYTDPDFHLRLRLHVTHTGVIGAVIAQVHAAMQLFEQQSYIWKTGMDTYNRELERYGANTIVAAEKIFHYDSMALVEMLEHTWGDERETVRWLWGLRSVDKLLDAFQFTLAEKLALMNVLRSAFASEFNMDKLLKIQLDNKHRTHRTSIEEVLQPELPAQHQWSPLISILDKKSEALKETMSILLLMNANQQLQVPLYDLAGHHIHMLLNRLFPSAQRLHELITYDILVRYYGSAVARRKKEAALQTDKASLNAPQVSS